MSLAPSASPTSTLQTCPFTAYLRILPLTKGPNRIQQERPRLSATLDISSYQAIASRRSLILRGFEGPVQRSGPSRASGGPVSSVCRVPSPKQDVTCPRRSASCLPRCAHTDYHLPS